ncbi:MAG: ABC transporter substrate-binding protein [Deltaproteobacteria bacterium]|jgi:iron complex transport system substrate-binding protein|nr:ABC transporter substrate-binding protein [Deltaproteobacteria bacterium]
MTRSAWVLILVLIFGWIWFLAAGPAREARAQEPPRIISLYAAHTENLLRMGARDLLVGISAQETYAGPETAGWTRPPVFSVQDDVEKYLAARPTLILMRPQYRDSAPHLWAALEKSGIRIWARQVLRHEELDDYWLELGRIAGRPEEARKMTAEFQAAVRAYEEKPRTRRPGVFLEAIHQTVKTFTPESLPIWAVTLAGGRNAAPDPDRLGSRIVADFGPERLLGIASDVDIYLSQEGPMNRASLETVLSRDLFRELPAFRNRQVYKVPEIYLTRPTPDLLKGIELVSGIIDAFEKTAAGPGR